MIRSCLSGHIAQKSTINLSLFTLNKEFARSIETGIAIDASSLPETVWNIAKLKAMVSEKPLNLRFERHIHFYCKRGACHGLQTTAQNDSGLLKSGGHLNLLEKWTLCGYERIKVRYCNAPQNLRIS